MFISDWISDVCSSDLTGFQSSWCARRARQNVGQNRKCRLHTDVATHTGTEIVPALGIARATQHGQRVADREFRISEHSPIFDILRDCGGGCRDRSEEHTSELQSLMRISYAVFCLKKKTLSITHNTTTTERNMKH